jgi:hypothetical protein
VSGFPTLKLFPLHDGPPETYYLDDTDAGGGPSTGEAYRLAEQDAERQFEALCRGGGGGGGEGGGDDDDDATMTAPANRGKEEDQKGAEDDDYSSAGLLGGSSSSSSSSSFEARYPTELPNMVAFLNAKAGTQRSVNENNGDTAGGLLPMAGRNAAIERFLKERPVLLAALAEGEEVEGRQGGSMSGGVKVGEGVEVEEGNEDDHDDDAPSEEELLRLAPSLLLLHLPTASTYQHEEEEAAAAALVGAVAQWSASRRSDVSGNGWVLGTGMKVKVMPAMIRDSPKRALTDLKRLVDAAVAKAAKEAADDEAEAATASPTSSDGSSSSRSSGSGGSGSGSGGGDGATASLLRRKGVGEDSKLYVKAIEKVK